MTIKHLVRDIREDEGRPIGTSCSDPIQCITGICTDGRCDGCTQAQHQIIDQIVASVQSNIDSYVSSIVDLDTSVCPEAGAIGQNYKDVAKFELRDCCELKDYSVNPNINWQNCIRLAPGDVEDDFWSDIKAQCPELRDLGFCKDIRNEYSRLRNYINFIAWDLEVGVNPSSCGFAVVRRDDLRAQERSVTELPPLYVEYQIIGLPYQDIRDEVDDLLEEHCPDFV